jgi:hypothetical protein
LSFMVCRVRKMPANQSFVTVHDIWFHPIAHATACTT